VAPSRGTDGLPTYNVATRNLDATVREQADVESMLATLRPKGGALTSEKSPRALRLAAQSVRWGFYNSWD